MAAKKLNQYWEMRNKHGRNKVYKTPEDLWSAACDYFEWVRDNPLLEEKVFHYQGDIIKTEVKKMRAMSIKGLCNFLDVNEAYFRQFKDNNNKGFSTIIESIESIVYVQKFEGAAADLLNQSIIARELGLKEHTDLTLQEGNISSLKLPDFMQ